MVLLLSSTIGQHIVEGKQPTLLSFSTIHFAGYLFFLIMPVEVLLPYYLVLDYNMFLLLAVAVLTALIAQFIDYAIGNLAPSDTVKELIGIRRYKRAERVLSNHGKIIIFIFNLFPLSSPIVVLVAGMMKFKLRHTMLYSFLGLVLKYSAVISIFYLF